MVSQMHPLIIYLLSLVLTRSQSSFRLPTTILPINYELQLHPDIPGNNFDGIESIYINITQSYFDGNTDGNFDVSFNYYPGMEISAAELLVTGPNANIYSLDGPLATDTTTQIATATFDVLKTAIQTFVNAGTNEFILYMEYTAQIRGGTDLAGLYKSVYTYNDNVIENLVTQFQATDARSAFPCFDEPAFKATFDITFIAPIDAVKLSNMPIETSNATEGVCTWTSPMGVTKNECEMVTFERTPKMSTYLVAFVIGGYLQVDDDASNPPQSVYYPYTFETEERAQFALTQSVKVLDLFGGPQGFNIPFTDSGIPKLDSIGVTLFAAGAMENWGLCVYRTVRLLVDEQISSQAAKSGQITIIAHELAHQWFGNLVSPNWWDDLWLNEGFATYMAFYGGNLVPPGSGYNLNELKLQAIANVMIDDSSIFTHSVKQEIEGDPTQILSSFSSITYQKGMGVINTIANVMGNDAFLGGISTYLRQYQFDTATSQQLGDVLDTVSDGISKVMDSFILQEGFPLIFIDTEDDGNNLTFTITQQRFVKQGPDFYENPQKIPFVTQEMVTSFSEQLWRVPMLWRSEGVELAVDGTFNDIMLNRTLINTEEEMPYYLVNPVVNGLYNFFRVHYDDYSLQLIVDNFGDIGNADQFAIISDRYALMVASYITPESYLDFIRDVIDKMLNGMNKGVDIPDYPIFNVIIQSLLVIDDVFCELVFEGNTADDKALRGYFREFAQDLLRRALDFVVDDISKPFVDDHALCPADSDCNILQAALLNALVRFNDRETILRGYELFYLCANQVCEQPAPLCRGCAGPKISEDGRITFVSEDVLQAMFAAVLSYDTSSSTDLNNILNVYQNVNIEQQTYILNALGSVYSNNNLVQQALDFIMSDEVQSNMKVNALVGMKICTAREPLWQYITDGSYPNTVFDELFSGTGLFSQEPLTSLANTFASNEKYADVSSFFSEGERTNAGTVRILNQTLENVYSRFLWKTESQSGMELYVRTYIVNKYESAMKIWQIILLTILCCAGLILLVIAFWGISKPTDSDRIVHYMSMKREKKIRKKSSLGAGQALTSSLGHSIDRTMGHSQQHSQQQTQQQTTTTTTTTTDDKVELQEATPDGGNKNNIIEDEDDNKQQQQQQQKQVNADSNVGGNGGYGATQGFNYQRLKEDDEQTS